MKSDRIYLKHILDATAKIKEYVSVGHEEFLAHSHWHDATMRQLEIIGEATKVFQGEFGFTTPMSPGGALRGCAMC